MQKNSPSKLHAPYSFMMPMLRTGRLHIINTRYPSYAQCGKPMENYTIRGNPQAPSEDICKVCLRVTVRAVEHRIGNHEITDLAVEQHRLIRRWLAYFDDQAPQPGALDTLLTETQRIVESGEATLAGFDIFEPERPETPEHAP